MSFADAQSRYEALKNENLSLDITRGKPAADQLDLSNPMLDIPADQLLGSGVDARNYGGLDGTPEGKALGALLLDAPREQVLVGGNGSLTLMYHAVLNGWLHGYSGQDTWQTQRQQGKAIKFLCPVPGYDRHFAITESFGIEMVNVNMNDDGPEMDQVESLLRDDPSIKGMWCVPKYSNPTGAIYSDAVVERIAKLGKIAAADFRVFYDNAYAVHDLDFPAAQLKPIWPLLEANETSESVIQFASTSKITFAGAGVAFLSAGDDTLTSLKKHLGVVTIGPDKLNQARHAKWLGSAEALTAHMQKHAQILQPKFDCVLDKLESNLADGEFGHWQSAKGGYFVSFFSQPGLASKIVQLCAEAGVKLTPAGAAYPHGKDPEDSHIRLAPSFPTLSDLNKAMDVFVAAVQVATLDNK